MNLTPRYALFLAIIASAIISATACTHAADASPRIPLLDEIGRELIAGGYVVITEDSKGKVRYAPDDYRRMVRMGANFQVIRTTLGRLGGWPGKEADAEYLEQLDAMVRMGKEVGLKTIFKLVVYDVRPFGHEQWDAIWNNTNGSRNALTAAWRKLWIRYKDEPSVFGYDLLNEPRRGLDKDEERCCREHLLPTLRRLADAMHAVSPDKWALYQPLYREVGTGEGPFLPMKEPLDRDRVIYAPHLYSMDVERMRKMLDRYAREAALSDAPLLLGEWGPATDIAADTDPVKQARYTKVYRATAREIDRCGIGAIKAWFCGTRAPLRAKNRRDPFTWAIFSDITPAGRVERKYITDTLARPRPLVVAGRLEEYAYDAETRTLRICFHPDRTLGATEIFVPADRFYPDGFRLELGSDLAMDLKPDAARPRIVRATTPEAGRQAAMVHWEIQSGRLRIDKWVLPVNEVTLAILPLSVEQTR